MADGGARRGDSDRAAQDARRVQIIPAAIQAIAIGLAFTPLPAAAGDTLADYLAGAVADLYPPAVEALRRIDGLDRQLLAAHSYLRARDSMADRWSWTDAEIAAYAGSPEQLAIAAEIDRVCAVFAAENEGFSLYANPEVRSLDVQLQHWNNNSSVAAAAGGIIQAARDALAANAFPPASTPGGRQAFQRFLTDYRPTPSPTLAAPGLSLHGRMRAVDFQVRQGERVVAGTDENAADSEWWASGWAARLRAAVTAAGARFVGPLEKPPEPWHYDYQP